LKTPWTTSEKSQVEFVANELVRRIEEGREAGKMPVLFVTPHKTATTAHFHPEALVHQLAQRGLKIDQDYQMVCDITSGAGAIDYFTDPCRKGMSVFGSIQKALGCPAGLGFVGLSGSLSKLFETEEYASSGLTQSVDRTKNGQVLNSFGLRMLGEKCRYELEQGKTVIDLHEETRRKVQTVIGFMSLHKDLCHQVPSGEDQSPLLVGLYSITHNLAVALRLMEEIFGYRLGAGYGPFSQESLRLYLPTISPEELDKILSALHAVLKMPEVTKTVNPKAPIVSLREPHDPLQVLENMVTGQITPDDLFTNNLGLGWLGRLQYTFQLGKHTPYGSSENFDQIRAILSCRLDGSDSLLDTYSILEAKMDRMKYILLEGNEVDLSTVEALVESMYSQLKDIVLILRKYAKTAPRTRDGRIKWPLAATPEQLVNGNGSNGNGKNGGH
jgi:aspartate aminotransferase-like enzyme